MIGDPFSYGYAQEILKFKFVSTALLTEMTGAFMISGGSAAVTVLVDDTGPYP